jgi:hypothetical protein
VSAATTALPPLSNVWLTVSWAGRWTVDLSIEIR